jgi:hypothetical protein
MQESAPQSAERAFNLTMAQHVCGLPHKVIAPTICPPAVHSSKAQL